MLRRRRRNRHHLGEEGGQRLARGSDGGGVPAATRRSTVATPSPYRSGPASGSGHGNPASKRTRWTATHASSRSEGGLTFTTTRRPSASSRPTTHDRWPSVEEDRATAGNRASSERRHAAEEGIEAGVRGDGRYCTGAAASRRAAGRTVAGGAHRSHRGQLVESAPRPAVVGINGARPRGGKTTLAGRMAAVAGLAGVVHTDDVAWNHWGSAGSTCSSTASSSRSEPGKESRSGHRRGTPTSGPAPSRCPRASSSCWSRVSVSGDPSWPPCSTPPCGSSPTATRPTAATACGSAPGETSTAGYEGWMAEEIPFLAEQRPWEHAQLVIAGTPTLPHDPITKAVVATTPSIR